LDDSQQKTNVFKLSNILLGEYNYLTKLTEVQENVLLSIEKLSGWEANCTLICPLILPPARFFSLYRERQIWRGCVSLWLINYLII